MVDYRNYYDFGGPPSIQPPPEGDVVTIDEALEGLFPEESLEECVELNKQNQDTERALESCVDAATDAGADE